MCITNHHDMNLAVGVKPQYKQPMNFKMEEKNFLSFGVFSKRYENLVRQELSLV